MVCGTSYTLHDHSTKHLKMKKKNKITFTYTHTSHHTLALEQFAGHPPQVPQLSLGVGWSGPGRRLGFSVQTLPPIQ